MANHKATLLAAPDFLAAANPIELRTYRLKKARGPILLACAKCRKRVKNDGDTQGIVPLKKLLKQSSKAAGSQPPFVLKIPCLKLCPRDGIVVLTGKQVAAAKCSIIRTQEDLEAVARALRQ